MKHKIQIWSDGSYSTQNRIGGWGTVIIIDGIEMEIAGSALDTTINRMEITAAMKGLILITSPTRIELYTDSKYVRDGILKNGWVSAGPTTKNYDLWVRMNKLINYHLDVKPIWVPGHSNIMYNERADVLAGDARKKRVRRVVLAQDTL